MYGPVWPFRSTIGPKERYSGFQVTGWSNLVFRSFRSKVGGLAIILPSLGIQYPPPPSPPRFLPTGTRIVFTKRRPQRCLLFYKGRTENVLLSFRLFLVFQQLFKLNWDSSLQSLLQLKTPIGTPTSLTSFPIKAKAPKPIPCQQRFLSGMASGICEVLHVACQSSRSWFVYANQLRHWQVNTKIHARVPKEKPLLVGYEANLAPRAEVTLKQCSGGYREGARGAPSPPYFSTKMRPEGPTKIFFGDRPPPAYLRVWMTAPPPPPPHLKVWISHCNKYSCVKWSLIMENDKTVSPKKSWPWQTPNHSLKE